MFSLDGIRKSNDNEVNFELWTKELEKELPNFWNQFMKKP